MSLERCGSAVSMVGITRGTQPEGMHMAVISAEALSALIDDAGYAATDNIAVAVVNPDGTITRAERGVLTTSTRVYGASLTKQIVALLLAREVDSGRLDPDAPISTWFPDFPAWAQDVSVRDMVHHRSGLPDEETLGARLPDPDHTRRTEEDMIAAVRTFDQLPSGIGEKWAYSNIGYVLLGRILEASSGQPLKALFAERVFAPLAMSDSLLWNGPELNP